MNLEKKIGYIFNKFFDKNKLKTYKFVKLVNKYFLEEKRKDLIDHIQSIGYGLKLEGENWYINLPGHVIIGNNVRIGGGIYFETEGGLVIGDNTWIGSGVTITTINGRKYRNDEFVKSGDSVFIGKNVWIGANVSISAGLKIGDGANIGMGTVVNRDIAPNEKVNMPNLGISKQSVKICSGKSYPNYFDIPGKKLCFTLGTGRCGSKSIAKNLGKHPEINAQHENIRQFIRLSTEFAYNRIDRKEVKDEVIRIFQYKTEKSNQSRIILHSDQRFWNMVPIFKEIFPEAKFIHLIRDGRDTVRSMYARGWFADQELSGTAQIKDKQWAIHRLNGYLTGDVDKKIWNSWNSFERCCWYWNFINNSIHSQLSEVSNKYLLRLEDIDSELIGLFDFLGVKKTNFKFEKYNSVNKKNKKKYKFFWGGDEEKIFQRIAGETQSKFYE